MISTISELVAKVESNGIPYAMRFEPKFTVSPQAVNNCIRAYKPLQISRATAEMICRTSWGKFQIMGENLYTVCAFASDVNHFMNSDADQEFCFQRFIEKRGINFTLEDIRQDAGKMSMFARRYNGSSEYAVTLKRAMGW